MRLPILLLSLAAIFSLSNFVLDNDTSVVYVEATELDPKSYKDLVLASLENDFIEIQEACVPAKVLKIGFSGDSTEMIKTFFSETAGLQDVTILNGVTEDQFLEKCHNARTGR